MNRLLVILFWGGVFLPGCLLGQKQGDIWMLGNKAFLDFSSGNPVVDQSSTIVVEECGGILADKSGNLRFYTNGNDLLDSNHDTIQNWVVPNGSYYIADSRVEGNLVLPINDTLVFVLSIVANNAGTARAIFYSQINPVLNGGNGVVISLHNPLFNDCTENLRAVRHADGQSWWVIARRDQSDLFYKAKISPDGSLSVSDQNIGSITPPIFSNYSSQMVFNQDGDRFAVSSDVGKIEIFGFDRCEGIITLEDSIVKPPVNGNAFYGISFSPNGRFLYISDRWFQPLTQLYQYDLFSSNIESSEIVVWEEEDDSYFEALVL